MFPIKQQLNVIFQKIHVFSEGIKKLYKIQIQCLNVKILISIFKRMVTKLMKVTMDVTGLDLSVHILANYIPLTIWCGHNLGKVTAKIILCSYMNT